MSQDETIALVTALAEHMEPAPDDWRAYAIVLSLDDPDLTGVYGYAYDAAGAPAPVRVRPSEVAAEMQAYLVAHYGGAPPLVRVLVQFDRASGRYGITFDEKHKDRWRVTDDNCDALGDQLRPAFHSAA